MGEGSHSGRSKLVSDGVHGLDVFIPGIIRQISWRQLKNLKISKQKEDKEDTSKACGSIPSSASTPILLIIPSVASSTLFAGSISISWWPPAAQFPPCGEAGSKVPAPSACESSSELSAANGEGRELRDELRIAPRLIIISGDPKATFSDPIFVGVPYFACRKHSNVGQLWI
jgi:hypothetical protein